MEFLENKSPLLMKIALINHTVISIIFTFLFLIFKEELDSYYKIYVCSILFLFVIYMIYFAHHSVNYFDNFRHLELIKLNYSYFF